MRNLLFFFFIHQPTRQPVSNTPSLLTCGSTVVDDTTNLQSDALPNCQDVQDGVGGSLGGGFGGTRMYTFRGNGDRITLSTCNPRTAFDTKIRIYDDSETCIAGNDDGIGCTGFRSRVNFVAEEGVEYQVALDGYRSASGAFELSIDCEAVSTPNPPTPNPPTPNPPTPSTPTTFVSVPCPGNFDCYQNNDFGNQDNSRYNIDMCKSVNMCAIMIECK